MKLIKSKQRNLSELNEHILEVTEETNVAGEIDGVIYTKLSALKIAQNLVITTMI